jgi:hypothetical protein
LTSGACADESLGREPEDLLIAGQSSLGVQAGPDRRAAMSPARSAVIRRGWHQARWLAWLASLFLTTGSSTAETWTTAGMSFSDRPGGARLLSASGFGTRDDPIVLVEEIAGPGPGVLEIRNGRTAHLDVSPATGFLTLSVVKIIVNRGPWRWTGFDLELLTGPDQPSVYTDGLSFDQPQTFQRLARADRFLQTVQEDEPFDRIRFDGGQVDPAEYLRLDFDIVDVNGTAVFYLVQRPLILLAWDLPLRAAQELAAYSQPLPADLAD